MIRIALVDDHAPVRQSLRDYLDSCPGLQVVAEGRNGAQAAAIAVDLAPDVLVMDLAMPGQNGMDGLADLRARAPGVAVLILSGYPPELFAPAMLARGAAGFVHKHCAPEQIVEAVRAVAQGRAVPAALPLQALAHRPSPSPAPAPAERPPVGLTRSEDAAA